MNRISWTCEQGESGWLIIAEHGAVSLAMSIGKKEWREVHDQSWLFESVIRTLGRNVKRVLRDTLSIASPS